MSKFCLRGGRIFDPKNGVEDKVGDIFIDGDRITTAEGNPKKIIDVKNCIVMAGAIDMHTHIGGGKVNIARTLMPEDHPAQGGSFSGHCAMGTLLTGQRYAEMGYTSCFEPAVIPINARQAHLEMGDTPIIDTGGYAMLGNDDFLLNLLSENVPQSLIDDYVAWTLHATKCVAVKVANPGGINAFKFNQRSMDLDEANTRYGVTPRRVLQVLAQAVWNLGLAHPLHVHGCNLGVAGNSATTLKTIAALEGLPVHLTHIQFHSYGKEGPKNFSSDAQRIADVLNASNNISADVGQVMFGQTVTASADTMAQHHNVPFGSPKKSVIMDIECESGCGVIPFRYREKSFVNALQWAIGLELFLLVHDPWRIFLTTDHPNGAPFTSYPILIRLLMDAAYRREVLATLHPEAAAHTCVGEITREYSLNEIAILTRAAPARILGLTDQGHLAPGASADIVVYEPNGNPALMFAKPRMVFKSGTLVAEEGKIVNMPKSRPHVIFPEFDRKNIENLLSDYFHQQHTVRLENYAVGMDELQSFYHGTDPRIIACESRR